MTPDFRALFENLPGAHVVLLPDAPVFPIVAVSAGYLAATGTVREQLVGHGLFEIFPENPGDLNPNGILNLTASFARVICSRGPDRLPVQKYDLRRPDETFETRHWSMLTTPVLNDSGAIEYLIHTVEDVTAPIRAEQRRQDAEVRLRLATEAAELGIWVWHIAEDRVTWENDKPYEIVGLHRTDEPVNAARFISEFLHRDDIAGFGEVVSKTMETGSRFFFGGRIRRTDGELRWVEFTGIPHGGADGKPEWIVGTMADLTQRKQLDDNLRQQWRTFDTVLSHTPDFASVVDLQGRLRYANRSLLTLWQKTLDEVIGTDIFQLTPDADASERLKRQVQQAIQTRKPVRDRTGFTGANAEAGFYEYILVPLLASDGSVEGLAIHTRDITEQKRAEQIAEEDRRRWRDLLRQTPAAIAVLRGPEHRFEWVNPDYVRLVGRPEQELVGKTVLEALPEVAGQVYVGLLDEVYRTGQPFLGHESPVGLKRGDGELENLFVDFMYAPTRAIDGAIDGVFAHVTDVTSMVLSRQRVEESERQFRTLAESIPNLAFMADETGHIFWYNRRWFDYTGTTLEEMEGWGWQKVHDPKVLPDVVKLWSAALTSGEPFEMVFPLRGADGKFRTFLTRVEPLKSSDGKVARWFGTNTDITEQRNTEEELRRMNRELEEFAYVSSHDLQEPLRMVNIYTQLMLKRLGRQDSALDEYAGFIQQGVNRMDALIHDLLAFSRTVHREQVTAGVGDLQASLTSALAVLKSRIEESGAVILNDPLPTVRGDSDQLSHVFENLIGNSIKYRRAEVTPHVRISIAPAQEEWRVAVQDNGIGFDPRYSERIFGLFKRLHKEDVPGTGLGLAICRRIVERYGGRIWAEASPGEGATFYFTVRKAERS